MLSLALVAAGVVLETWLEHVSLSIPSLPGFVWGLAKGTILGTIALSVLDDIRTWGTRWRATVLKLPEMLEATDQAMTCIAEGIDPNNHRSGGQGAPWLVKRLYPTASFFYALGEVPADPAYRLSWEQVEGAWSTAFDRPSPDAGLRRRLERGMSDAESTELAASISVLDKVLQSLSADASIVRSSHIARIRFNLRVLPRQIDAVRASLAVVARDGEGPNAPAAAIGVWAAIHGVLDTVEIVAKEADSGMPHPRRESPFWVDL